MLIELDEKTQLNLTSAEQEVVDYINNHPLVPNDVKVHGLIMNPHTGKVELV